MWGADRGQVRGGPDRARAPSSLKPDGWLADAVGMSATPEWLEAQSIDGGRRQCPDCGAPFEAAESYRICQACYDAYVDNAGR